MAIHDKEVAVQVGRLLLHTGAVQINFARPFIWSAGWRSPIYCDNRLTLSFPEVRTYLKEQLVDMVRNRFPNGEVIAAVATAAIAQGVLIADTLKMPFCYVRPSPKSYGTGQQVEGRLLAGQKVVVVEDLISTAQSCLKVLEVLRAAGAEVVGVATVFSYGFAVAEDALRGAGAVHWELCDLATLLELAMQQNRIQASEAKMLNEWQQAPDRWWSNTEARA